MAGSSGTNCVNTPAVGNKCLSCSTMGSNYKCTGGTACPQLNQVDCPAGQYLPANSTTCKACLDKYYCPGGKHTANYNADQGLNKCPDGADGSDSNRSALAHCYKNCPAKNISGGTTAKVKEKVQYDGSKYPTCTYTVSCNAGYGASGNSSADPKCTQCVAGQYGAGGTNSCSKCPSDYPSSDAGTSSEGSCYKEQTKTGEQLEPAMPAGCASRSLTACSPKTCTWRDYKTATDTNCSADSCTKSQTCTSASSNYYLENGSAKSCSTVSDGTYQKSDGGNITNANCYKMATKNGTQKQGTTPSGCDSVTAWNTCATKSCEYKDYYAAVDESCVPTDCIQTAKSVKAAAGSYVKGSACEACPDGSYCTGGTYTLDSTNQGIITCPNGASGSSMPRSAPAHCYKTCAATKTISGGSATRVTESVQYNAGTKTYPDCTYYVNCNAGYGASGDGTANPTCSQCPAGQYSAGAKAECKSCGAGTYTSTAGKSSCTSCEADYYCAGGNSHVQCTGNTTTNSKTGQTSAAACVCKAGYGFANNACTACANGTYKGTAGNSACTGCPVNSTTSSTGNTAQSACQCNAGYTGNAGTSGGSCTACEKGKYKTSIGSDACTACTANSTTSGTGSKAKTDCQCNAGYSGNAGTSTCTACTAGTYKTSMANTACTTCPEHSTTSGTGKTAKTDCICNAGYSGNAGTGTCTACTAGTYKASAGNVNCTNADAGYFATGTGNTSQTACNKGTYTATAGQASCTSCSGATYQDATGQKSCKNCPVESGWAAGQGTGWTAVTNCYETQKPANCASGTIKKVATSANGWGTATVENALTANTGYYVNSTSCVACSNGPANSTYTSNGGSSNSCSWNCNNGYGKTFESKCVLKCTAGISTLHAGTNVSVQLYDARSTTPSIVIQKGDKMCYGNLTKGNGTNALNVTYKDATYHTVN